MMSDQKRKLTTEEIEDILSFIKPKKNLPIETGESLVKISKGKLRKQLSNQVIYPELISKLKEIIEVNFYKTRIQPGESVAILSAQSIGEKQTQSQLNSFHKAGSSENAKATGTSRFSELLNATKDQKLTNCYIYFIDHNDKISELRNEIGSDLVGMTLSNICLSHNFELNKKPEKWYDAFKILYNDRFEEYTDCISLKINIEELYKYKLTLKNISDVLESEYSDLKCVFSSDNIGQLDLFINTSSIELPEERLIFITNSDESRTGNVVEIYLEEVVFPIINKITFNGIKGVSEMYYKKDDYDKQKWMVETDGCNYQEIMGLPMVDSTKTISNNIWDIYHTLGIEATREYMINEFMNIMPGINICHVKLLVDKMTYEGIISSISRYSMRSEDCGPLSKASFEETCDNLNRAGVYGQIESTKGVSASIICGKRANFGTGLCDLKIDLKALEMFRLEKEESNEISYDSDSDNEDKPRFNYSNTLK